MRGSSSICWLSTQNPLRGSDTASNATRTLNFAPWKFKLRIIRIFIIVITNDGIFNTECMPKSMPKISLVILRGHWPHASVSDNNTAPFLRQILIKSVMSIKYLSQSHHRPTSFHFKKRNDSLSHKIVWHLWRSAFNVVCVCLSPHAHVHWSISCM